MSSPIPPEKPESQIRARLRAQREAQAGSTSPLDDDDPSADTFRAKVAQLAVEEDRLEAQRPPTPAPPAPPKPRRPVLTRDDLIRAIVFGSVLDTPRSSRRR